MFLSVLIVFKFSSYFSCMLYLTSNVLFFTFSMLSYHFKNLKTCCFLCLEYFPTISPFGILHSFFKSSFQYHLLCIVSFGPVSIQSGWTRVLPLCSCNALYASRSHQVSMCCNFCAQALTFISLGAL